MKTKIQKLLLLLLLLGLPGVVQAQLTFTTNNGAITITGYDPSAGLNVVIPAMTNGYPVTSIGASAFQSSDITSVTIPTSITSIEEDAFEYCFSHCKERRAITREEHELILSRERNPEMRAFLWCCWHIGGSQSDVAHLKAEDIDWRTQVVSFFRAKTGTAQIIHFGVTLAEVLRDLPENGLLFPQLAGIDEKHRAARFQRACRREGVTGISLHSYRYAWAERAKIAGYPERFAQMALGHNSKAIHRAYARNAQVVLPPLEDYERKIVPLNTNAREFVANMPVNKSP